MSIDFVDLCSDEEAEVKLVTDVRPDFATNLIQEKANFILTNSRPTFEEHSVRLWPKENGTLIELSNSSQVTAGENLSANGFCHVHALPGSVPICRQFWKAGDYKAGAALHSQNGQNHLRVHPKFLHSNATSHKWAFGAIAELLDNAVDEVQNGATFVIVDKLTNTTNGNHALLIQDDGGGMNPESLRHCMSFGYSDKHSDSIIGEYGNGFKTSTMRLGADVIVFTRCMDKRKLTQSIGLLSYTFLRKTGCDDIVVPMVDYEFDPSAGEFRKLLRHGQKRFSSNLSTILKWSPFATEVELLKQLDDIGHHGTKVVVYNLWFNDDGDMELDFDTDAEDIMISGAPKTLKRNKNAEKHIADSFRYSLRVYSSILYLHLPENFRIFLRGRVVEPHYIVNDLIYRECIRYKPQVGGFIEPSVITTIGFLNGAPQISVHGFNIYHKNRLILPFSAVFSNTNGKGRGVAGVLEANFIKPTHNKQDFEKSILYQKLETRLKDMTVEYWNYHCHLIGYPYPFKNFPPPTSALSTATADPVTSDGVQQANILGIHSSVRPVRENLGISAFGIAGASEDLTRTLPHLSAERMVVTAVGAPANLTPGKFFKNCSDRCQTDLPPKRRHVNHFKSVQILEKPAVDGDDVAELGRNHRNQHCGRGRQIQQVKTMILKNKKLHSECLEFEKGEKQLLLKEKKLRNELQEVQRVYRNILTELKSMDGIKL